MNNTATTSATLEELATRFHACLLFSNRAGHSDEFLFELAAEMATTTLATLQAFE